MPPAPPLPSITVVLDRHDDTLHTHTALAAHHPPSGRITLHPGPGTTSETGLAHDLLAALGKPPLLPGRFPGGRQPAWEAATAWMTALPVTRLTVLRTHRLTARRTMRLLQLQARTGIHLTLVCHRPHLPAALHQALRTADYSVTADIEAARRHYYGTPVTEPPPADEPATPASRWLTLPALDRLVSYDSPCPCADPCTPPQIAWRHRPPPAPLTAHTAQQVAHRLHAATAHPRLAAAVAAALFTGASLGLQGCRTFPEAAHAAEIFLNPLLDGSVRGNWDPSTGTWQCASLPARAVTYPPAQPEPPLLQSWPTTCCVATASSTKSRPRPATPPPDQPARATTLARRSYATQPL
ncbi:hypothetical protein [Streptomyces tibetensis]|uniref:hypothetical protein n=1 Tax=Streptomyces tibetensis TaxID=2382123 RepID=UPI0033D7CC89